MTVKTTGFRSLKGKIRRAVPIAQSKFASVNKENAEDVAALARVLVPKGETLTAVASIRTFKWPGDATAYAVSFGPLSRILEGGTEERFTTDGQARGRSPARPFVTPAFGGTRAKRKARNRKAVRDAWKQADG